jgi:Excalibur calcium-binding domain
MNDNSAASARSRIGWKPTKLFWIVAVIVLFILLVAALSGGFGGVLVFLGIIALLTGLYALLFKRRTWVGIPHRKSAAAVTVSGILVFMLGGVVAAGATPSSDDSTASLVTEQQPTVTSTPTPTETNPVQSPCPVVDESRTYNGEVLICTVGSDDQLIWLAEAESRSLVEAREAKAKAAAVKLAADKAAAQKAAAKAAADKLAAEKAAAKAASDKLAAEKAAAEAAAARKAAEKAAADQAAAAKAAAARAAAEQAAAQQAAQQAVVPAAPAPASVYYGNCSAARAAGAAPVYAGSPGYGVHLDRDRDGVGCE